MMDPSVTAILARHKEYFQEQDNGRIVCTLNNHSLPASRQALEAFVNGKKYAQLRKRADDAATLGKYEPFLVPSKNFPDQLYCSLTCQIMQAKLDTVKKHMSGKRFEAAKAEFTLDQRELMEEPELENSEDAEPDFVAQDDGASPMQEDSLRNAAYTDSPPVVQAKAELAVEAQGPSKYSGKRKQQDSSVNKLPRTRGRSGKRKSGGS